MVFPTQQWKNLNFQFPWYTLTDTVKYNVKFQLHIPIFRHEVLIKICLSVWVTLMMKALQSFTTSWATLPQHSNFPEYTNLKQCYNWVQSTANLLPGHIETYSVSILMCSMSVHYIIQKTLITNKCAKSFFSNCKYTLLHVSTLLGHLQGETSCCFSLKMIQQGRNM
jgi:hypothetical protein